MKHILVMLVIFVAALALFLFLGAFRSPVEDSAAVRTFEECMAAGNAVMESYPRQCRTPEGETFVEDIGNELEKNDLIRVDSPRPNAVISSPLTVRGEARGTWFFEASFPVRLFDGNGTEIAVVPAEAQEPWMTEEFVPFEGTLTFAVPNTPTGSLVFEKENPSGLPEHADELVMPVRFGKSTSREPSSRDGCVITGCSGQVCAEEEMITTCEYRPEYVCFEHAVCERQESGRCDWTITDTAQTCFDGFPDASDQTL